MKDKIISRRSDERGVTLVEVLFATAMIGALSVMFLNSFGSSVKTFHATHMRTEALILAQSKLEEVLGYGYNRIVQIARQGRFPEKAEPIHDSFRWQLELGPPIAETRLRALSVYIFWNISGQEYETSLMTYISPH